MDKKQEKYLEKFWTGRKNETRYMAWQSGFFRLRCDKNGYVEKVTFVKNKSDRSRADQFPLYLMLFGDLGPCKFLEKFGLGPRNMAKYEAWKNGFLRLQYNEDGNIEQAAFVKNKDDEVESGQLQLYFLLGNGTVTCKTESGFSGEYWNNNSSDFGIVFEDDIGKGAPKQIKLDTWINRCLKEMSG